MTFNIRFSRAFGFTLFLFFQKDIHHSLIAIKARSEKEMESIVDFVQKNKKNVASLALLSNSWFSHDPKRMLRGFVVTDSGSKGEQNFIC